VNQTAVKRPSAIAATFDGKLYIGSHQDYSVAIFKGGELTGYLGSGKNEFLSVVDIAVDDSTGDVYVADTKKQELKVYYASGAPKGTISGLHHPSAISVTQTNLYVLDAPAVPCSDTVVPGGSISQSSGNTGECIGSRIAILDKKGVVIKSIGGADGDQMNKPADIAVDKLGNVYVADVSRKAVLVFDRVGAYTGAMTSVVDELRFPIGLAIAPNGNLFVSSSETHSILEIGLSGAVSAGPGGTLEFKSTTGAAISLSALGY